LMGDTWVINVYKNDYDLAFFISKGYSEEHGRVMYVAKLKDQEVYYEGTNLDEVIRIISTKHRLLEK
jgi:hypothetical protein